MDPEVYGALRKVALSAARRAGATDAWAGDIADEAIAKLLEQDPQPDNTEAWIQTVASRLTFERHRKQPAEGWGDMPMTNPDVARGQRHYSLSMLLGSPTANVRRGMQAASVLSRLDAVEAKMLVMQAEGMSIKEIAAELGYSEGSVRTKISTARAKTRRRFPNRDDFDI